MEFQLTLKSGVTFKVENVNSQQEAMDWYKREINGGAEIVKCEWLNPEY